MLMLLSALAVMLDKAVAEETTVKTASLLVLEPALFETTTE